MFSSSRYDDIILYIVRTGKLLPSNSSVQAASVHSFSAAASGAIATLITHPFDVIKVGLGISMINFVAELDIW